VAVVLFSSQRSLEMKSTDGLGISYLALGQKNQAIQVYRRLQVMGKEAAQALFAEITKSN
jgi:hypothetical protein